MKASTIFWIVFGTIMVGVAIFAVLDSVEHSEKQEVYLKTVPEMEYLGTQRRDNLVYDFYRFRASDPKVECIAAFRGHQMGLACDWRN